MPAEPHVHLISPTQTPSKSTFQIEGWVISQKAILKLHLESGEELCLKNSFELSKKHPNHLFAMEFFGKGYTHNLESNTLKVCCLTLDGTHTRNFSLEPLPKIPFINIFESNFRFPKKVCILAPGPNGEKYYQKIPSEYKIIAVNKAVLIPDIQVSYWIMNNLSKNNLSWFIDADVKFNGTRIFRHDTAHSAKNATLDALKCYYFAPLSAPENKLSMTFTQPEGTIRGGGSVTANAIQLAYNFGATDILLCGVDMSGEYYWDGARSQLKGDHGDEWKQIGVLNTLIKGLIQHKQIKIFTLSPTKLSVPIYG